MRQWLVAGGVVERSGDVLLVCNRRRDGELDWSPPGGVVDDGETVREGLTREVREETGIEVAGWAGPIYVVQVAFVDLEWDLRVEAYRAAGVTHLQISPAGHDRLGDIEKVKSWIS